MGKWKQALKKDFTLTGYFLKGQLIAFTTRFFSGKIMEGYTHGIDYAYNKLFEIYRNILLDDIKAGIERKVSKISFGRTSIAMKSSVGAVPESLSFFSRIDLPLPNKLILPALQKIKPKPEYCRNPFA